MRHTKVQIIAEAGVNHNGNLKTALKLVDEAYECEVDVIKFQTFTAEKLVSSHSPKADYQLKVTDPSESQFEMLKKLELTNDDFKTIFDYCESKGIDFLSTPYTFEDAEFLNDIGVSGFKIASGQLTELPFLKHIARFQKQMILSTGMAKLSEVFEAVQAIREENNDDIIVLQCTTNYPSLNADANIRAMNTIGESCQVPIGYSDHVPENYACYAAVALGATVIEKHFTLDLEMEGPDHATSLNPTQFKELVKGIRKVEEALGSPLKTPTEAEKKNILGMKRSLVALKHLKKGAIIKSSDLGFKRPANGLSINMLEQVVGKKLNKDLQADEALQLESINW